MDLSIADHSNMEHHHDHNHTHSDMDHTMMSSTNHSMVYHSNHSHTDHSSHNMASHSMVFHISTHATILFQGWQTSNWQGMLGSCVAVFIMAALYEGLKVFREHLLKRSLYTVAYNHNSTQVPTTDSDVAVQDFSQLSARSRMLSLAHFIQTILHIIQIVVSYFLMLIFMTYNVYLCIAVALGAGAGYFLFGWKRASILDINEHCH